VITPGFRHRRNLTPAAAGLCRLRVCRSDSKAGAQCSALLICFRLLLEARIIAPAMAFLRAIRCSACGQQTQHLLRTLEQMIRLQSRRSENAVYINFACPECNELTLSHILPSTHTERLDPFADDMGEYVVTLECSAAGCGSEVMLFAPTLRQITDSRSLAAHIRTTWKMGSVVCDHGYPPAFPFAIVRVSQLFISSPIIERMR
jgi:hypothetical protein